MSKKEEKAKEYADWLHKEVEEHNGSKCKPEDIYYRNGDIRDAYQEGWDEVVKEQLQDNESKIIEVDTVLEYRNGQVFIKKMNTNEMPAILTFNIVDALNKTIVEYYKKDK